MSAIKPAAVQLPVVTTVITPGHPIDEMEAMLRYDAADPYAVQIAYGGTTKTFARDLLASGQRELTGSGDVRVWPWTSERGTYVALALLAPDGTRVLKLHRGAVSGFLRAAYDLVPAGEESQHLDVDAALAHLLGGGAGC